MSAVMARPAALAVSDSRLHFARSIDGRTFLAEQRLLFPYHITRIHRPSRAAARADLCLQSLGGGLIEGDDVTLRVRTSARGHARLSTQSATKVHSMRGGSAAQTVLLDVEEGARLEYLPNPLILFPDSDLQARTELRLHDGASAVVVDAFYSFDPRAAGQVPLSFINTVEIRDAAGRVLVRDVTSAQRRDFARPQSPAGVACQAAVFLLGDYADDTLVGYSRNDPGAVLATSRLPNSAGLCIRGFVAGAAALARVVDDVLALLPAGAHPSAVKEI